jgi:PAS domain S-box-containing protein
MTASGDRINVVHVDDDPDFAALTATRLQRQDDRLAVRTATSVADGLELLADGDVDCVVADYDVSRSTGIEFLEAVREDHPDLPFILYTGKGSEEVASEAISAGVTDYVQKAPDGNQYTLLANRILNAVEQFRATRRAAKQRRLNAVVRTINEALAWASTAQDIDERVCELVSSAEPYQFAWIGDPDPESGVVEPRAAAGIGEEYLERITVTTDERHTGRGPTGRAVRDEELAVLQDIPDDPQYEPWREAALEVGFRSSAAVPLVYDDTSYGVLNVYADRTNAFDDHEQQVLSTLGETIAHAHHRVQLQRQYAEQYRTLFEEAPVMIVFTRSVEGEPVIEDCNRAFADRLGYSREELRETPLRALYTDASTERLLGDDGYQRALTGEFTREQRTLVTRDGDEVLTVLRAAPRRDQDGEILGTHALYLDITDERQVRELERQNERLDEFASVVSHDLRNPLNVAEGRLTLAREECDSAHLDDVARALERMAALVDDLLTLAREGKSVETTTAVDLAATAENCWLNVGTADATLVTESTQTVQADRSRLAQLLENLFRNSVEHGGDDVTVTVGDLDDGFYVADDGTGIPASDRETVFESGYSTASQGTGFGLSIVSDIADAHGWTVSVTDSAEGGARFEVTGVERVE